jgi:uncharacterized protein with GYD domain
MAKYMLIASYTAEGAKGVLKDGGTKRRKAAKKAIESVGGTVDAFYFAFGSEDAYVLIDMPDHASAAAASLAVSSSGAVATRTVVLITPEEIDKAAEKSQSVVYRAPGR